MGGVHHLRVYRPAEHVVAFYDGRVEGYRFAEGSNWVDDGALSLGICSYAIVDGEQALVYDTQVSVEHASFIRRTLENEGAREFTVVLSHWHLDHVAGTAAFDGCEVIASERTAELLETHRAAIESGSHEGPPQIKPLVLPTRVFSGREQLTIGRIQVDLIQVDIHSDDATVIWLSEQRLLLAGDTMEDPITYVGEPERFDSHLTDLERLWQLGPERILPNHGDPDVIARGGYTRDLIRATQQYIDVLQRCRAEPGLRTAGLRELIAEPLEAGWINYFAPYEAVHEENLATVLEQSPA
ncbi:MAG: MBL fold metallo-hydrolase [Thermoleophilia bacterium]|nr:MBL fold metallo-hydrolase [Thermoleophilia bacterium]